MIHNLFSHTYRRLLCVVITITFYRHYSLLYCTFQPSKSSREMRKQTSDPKDRTIARRLTLEDNRTKNAEHYTNGGKRERKREGKRTEKGKMALEIRKDEEILAYRRYSNPCAHTHTMALSLGL